MKITYTHLAGVLSLFCISCTAIQTPTTQTKALAASALQPYGRHTLNMAQNLELISAAAHFGYTFEGTESQVYASIPNTGSHNYLQYELDGVYQKRVRVSGSPAEPLVIKAPAGGQHTVWVYKATEAHTGPVAIEKVTGQNVQALSKAAAPVIEFIGNSITCGAAADASEVPCGTGAYHDQHNALMAYGPRVAAAVGADYIISCVSGIGAYRNWNSDGPTMPQVYEKIDFQDSNPQQWNFGTVTPQVVSIALGTNDFSNGDGKKERLPFDSTRFVNEYVKFVQLVKSKYPKARVALLSSPMVNGNNRLLLQNALTQVKAQIDGRFPSDKPVALHFFQPMQASGCTGHPSVEEHAVLARELVPFYTRLLQPEK